MVTYNEPTIIDELTAQFLQNNYDYCYLRAKLRQAKELKKSNVTLITGSSYALAGILEENWGCAVNCSMHSQDVYYDYKVAQEAIGNHRNFSRCIVVSGYYMMFSDLSKGTSERDLRIPGTYYPLFRDPHNWKEMQEQDLWAFAPNIEANIRRECESLAELFIMNAGGYYAMYPRRSFYNLGGLQWHQVPAVQREILGAKRAMSHNHALKHKESVQENKVCLQEFVRYLKERNVNPIIVIAPATQEYLRYVNPEIKDITFEALDSIPEEFDFIDLNETNAFTEEDFIDTDHLNELGAYKMSRILVDVFGK